MPTLATAGSVSSFLASLRALAKRFLTLATEEGKQDGLRLLSMLGFALLAALLAFTGWLGLLAGVILALVENNVVSEWGALGIAALLSFAGAGGLVLLMLRRIQKPLFAATRRQLGHHPKLEIEEDEGSRPLVPYEQEVEDGRMAADAEYQVVRQRLRRRLGSALLITGGMLAAIAVVYRARAKRGPKDLLAPGRPNAWTKAPGSGQVLTPLLTALHLATRPQASAPQPGGKRERGSA